MIANILGANAPFNCLRSVFVQRNRDTKKLHATSISTHFFNAQKWSKKVQIKSRNVLIIKLQLKKIKS